MKSLIMDNLKNISIPKLNKQRWLVIVAAVTGIMIFIGINKSPLPLRLTVANLGSQSAAMVFMTYQPTRSCVYVYQSRIFFKGILKCDEKTTTHVLAIENLQPQSTYHAIIISGWRFIKKDTPNFTTKPISETAPNLPEPAYGSVTNQSGQPVADALVVVFPDQFVDQGVVTKTNVQGNFAVDISQFPSSYQTITVDVSTIEGYWDNQVFPREIHSPFNQLVVKPFVIHD